MCKVNRMANPDVKSPNGGKRWNRPPEDARWQARRGNNKTLRDRREDKRPKIRKFPKVTTPPGPFGT